MLGIGEMRAFGPLASADAGSKILCLPAFRRMDRGVPRLVSTYSTIEQGPCLNVCSWRSCRMSVAKALRFTQRRSFVSSVFGFTFIAAVVTVSASNLLPCPARPERGRFADSDDSVGNNPVVVRKQKRRWIEETRPEMRPP